MTGFIVLGFVDALVLQRSGLVWLTVVARGNYAAVKGRLHVALLFDIGLILGSPEHGLDIESYKYGSVKG